MKKQINPSIKAHLLPSLFILLSLLTIGVIPLVHGQRQIASSAHSQVPASAGSTNVAVPFSPTSANAIPSGIDGAGNSWSVVAPLPYNARGPFAVSDGTFVYIGGGYDGSAVHTDLLKYDPVANSYTPLASSADGHFLSQAVISGTKLYNIAGFGLAGQTTTTRIYDIPSNTWTTGTAIPEAAGLSDAATALYNGVIYVAGGYNGTGAISTLRSYTIATDTWTTLAPMPAALYLPGFGAINGKVYVASGNNGSTEVNTLYIYDIASNTWTTGATVPTPVTGPGCAVYNGKLYLFGGAAPFPTTVTITQAYDPVANTWTSEANMNVNRLWFYGGSVGSASIVAPGGDQTAGIPINDDEKYAGGGTPTPTPCPGCGTYTTSTLSGAIAAATTDTGNHCDDCVTTIALPFPVNLYGQSFSSAQVASNGSFDLTAPFGVPFTHGCLTLPDSVWGMAILAYQDDLRTDVGLSGCTTWANGCGIFTSVSGSAPSRVFHVVYQTVHFADNTAAANFEVRFYENVCDHFDIIYGATNDSGSDETSGVQASSAGPATTFSCGVATLTNGLDVRYTCTAPTPTPTPTPTPCAVWNLVANMPLDFYGGAAASNGTFGYVAGGYSFSTGLSLNSLYQFDPVGNVWTTLTPYPGVGFIEAVAVYYPTTNRIYVFGGEDAVSGTNYNNTRIFDIASGTWLADGATMPDVRSFMAGGYNPGDGMIYILSGYNTGNVTSAQPNTWQYNPVTNVWTDLTGTVAYPHPAGGFGFGVINNHVYTAGGRDASNTVINLTYDFNPAALTYTPKSNEPGTNNNVPGSGVAGGSLWVFGGGNPFSGPGARPGAEAAFAKQVAKLAPNVQALFKPTVPETTNSTLTYTPATDTWVTTAQNMNSVRSFVGGTNIGRLLLAAGGYNGASTTATAETLQTACGTVVSAVSRKVHGGAGTFDVNLPLTGNPGIECRTTGGTNDYTMVVTFSTNVTITGNPQAQLLNGTGCVGTGGVCNGNSVTVSGAVVTVPLTNIGNNQTINVQINGVNGSGNNAIIPMSILIGDTNGNGTVNAADVAQTKSQLGQVVIATNFRTDVNANGTINAADVAIVKQHSGTALAAQGRCYTTANTCIGYNIMDDCHDCLVTLGGSPLEGRRERLPHDLPVI